MVLRTNPIFKKWWICYIIFFMVWLVEVMDCYRLQKQIKARKARLEMTIVVSNIWKWIQQVLFAYLI